MFRKKQKQWKKLNPKERINFIAKLMGFVMNSEWNNQSESCAVYSYLYNREVPKYARILPSGEFELFSSYFKPWESESDFKKLSEWMKEEGIIYEYSHSSVDGTLWRSEVYTKNGEYFYGEAERYEDAVCEALYKSTLS